MMTESHASDQQFADAALTLDEFPDHSRRPDPDDMRGEVTVRMVEDYMVAKDAVRRLELMPGGVPAAAMDAAMEARRRTMDALVKRMGRLGHTIIRCDDLGLVAVLAPLEEGVDVALVPDDLFGSVSR